MARKFLYIIAGLVVLVIAVLFVLRFWAEDLTEMAFVPRTAFQAQPPLAPNVYDDPAMWLARPGLGARDFSRWLPQGYADAEQGQVLPAERSAAVFFVHPTSYLANDKWNGPLDDPESRERAELFVKAMASPFNRSIDLWAPRYRQAAFGAFLTDAPEATQALDLAYGDVLQAFDYFLETVGKDQPIVLAGHSQGAYLLTRLLRERVAGKPLARRIVAAYAIGWPVSPERDLPAMGLPACTAPAQTGCVVSWLSFAEPADTGMVLKGYARHRLLGAEPSATPASTAASESASEAAVKTAPISDFLCTNPLTGTVGGAAEAKANLGTLVPDAELKTGTLTPGMVPAHCGPGGFLLIGEPPELGPYVLPGNNYHVYDIPLFWANLRADVARREGAWTR